MCIYILSKNMIFSFFPNVWVQVFSAQAQESTQSDRTLHSWSLYYYFFYLSSFLSKVQTWLKIIPILLPALSSFLSFFTFPSFKMSPLWQSSGTLDLPFPIIIIRCSVASDLTLSSSREVHLSNNLKYIIDGW